MKHKMCYRNRETSKRNIVSLKKRKSINREKEAVRLSDSEDREYLFHNLRKGRVMTHYWLNIKCGREKIKKRRHVFFLFKVNKYFGS